MCEESVKNMKDIPGYEGLYAATQDGHIWSYKSNKFLSETPQQKGYLKVTLFKKGYPKKCIYVHKLIALTYISNPENKETVDHIDRNKTNNCYTNLRWASRSEQNINKDWTEKMQEAAERGGTKTSRPVEMWTIDHSSYIKTFKSCREAAISQFGDAQKNSLINRCANGNRPSAYGYWWKFCN